MKFYISDLHFGHKNIMSYDNRPFFNVGEMNETLITNWNSVVSKGDEVYILGDMFWKNEGATDILARLNGRKYLVLGNHDRLNADMNKHFEWVKEYVEIKYGDNHIILCHYPIPFFKNHTRDGYYHFYGHVHSSFEYNMAEHTRVEIERLYQLPCRMFNVGAMMPYINYTPRTFAEITNIREE